MFAILSLLIVLILSLSVVRIAAIALTLTGLSREHARFQARSAFTGAGFTTTESEDVVHHPVRRRIIMLLMLLGNAGIITVMSTLVLSFVTADPGGGITRNIWFRVGLLASGLGVLWTLANSRWIDRRLSPLVAWALRRWTTLDIRDYAGLLHLARGYVVSEMLVRDEDWVAGRTLADARLTDEGILVLGIQKPDGTYFGAPRGWTHIDPGDTLYLYGRLDVVAELDQRRAGYRGNIEHQKVVGEQRHIEEQERKIEEQAESA